MKALYPSFVQSPTTLNNAGTHSKIPWIEWHTREGPSTDAPTQVRADVENYNLTLVPLHREAWGKFQADLPVFKQAGEQAQIELAQRAKNEARRAEEASLRAENEARRAENEARRAEEASLRANQEAKLKEQAGEEVARLQRRVLELEHQLGSGDCP
ncbi:hypothetical protein FRC11_002906 [Ceratobasidium sp. 423]|nr:hypothetical protein FRC11_002906 [Ceratobasidium sp. 423]